MTRRPATLANLPAGVDCLCETPAGPCALQGEHLGATRAREAADRRETSPNLPFPKPSNRRMP